MEFNKTKTSLEDSNKTVNYEGGEAYNPETPEMGLYKVVINNLLEDKCYEEDQESLEKVRRRFIKCVEDGDEVFPLRLAAYARQEMYLRDISQLLLVLSSNHDETKRYVRDFVPTIIDRADEPCTVLAMQLQIFGKSIPKPLKKGINDALHKFDEYQFSKYDSDRRQVNLKDVLNLCHPKPRDEEHEEIFRRLIKGDLDDHPEVDPLEPPETWEVVISEKGNNKEAWEQVLPKMGLFAKIRNLRNMLEAGVDSESILRSDDLEYVQQSKIYPFRFFQAYKAIKEAGFTDVHAEQWLSDAINKSSENLPDELENTYAVADVSGSMESRLSNRSEMTYREIACLFASVLWKKGARIGAFANYHEPINPHHNSPVVEVAEKINASDVGGSTNGWKVFGDLVRESLEVDRIIFLTDMIFWDSTTTWASDDAETFREHFNLYRNQVNEDVQLYCLDLSSYGDLQIPEGTEGVYNVSGWSSNIIEFIEAAENPGQIIGEINSFSVSE